MAFRLDTGTGLGQDKSMNTQERYAANSNLLSAVRKGIPQERKGTFENYIMGMLMNRVDPSEFSAMVLLAESMVAADVEQNRLP